MASSNLRPISAAYRMLIGADRSKEEAERDVKQREWIWEFFLRNNSNGRLLTELLNAVPFPNENLYLKRLLLLRSLSLQLELRLFNEVTLDMLRALEEISRPSEGSLAGYRVQPVKRRKGSGNDNVETKISTSEAVKVNRRLPESLVGKLSPKGGTVEEELRHKGQKETVSLGRNLASSEVGGDRSEISCPLFEGPLWEMQLALMIEMTVKHLRGVSVSRKDFEAALMTYWGDVIIDTEEPVGEYPSFGGKREEIRRELWKVRDNLDLLDELTRRYTEEKVRTMLCSFLEIAWAETQESFLEKVSKDVVDGVYKPQNPDINRRSVRGVRGEDGAGMSRKEAAVEKPSRRTSRGKVLSRSRDKKQKALRLQIEDPEESEAEERADPQNLTKRGETGEKGEPAGTSKPSGIQSQLAEEPLQPSADNSHEPGDKGAAVSGSKEAAAAEAEVEDFDDEETGRSQPCGRDRVSQEDLNGVAEVGGPGNEDIIHFHGEDRRNVNTSPSSPNDEGAVHNHTRSPHNSKGLSPGDQEISEKPCDGAKVANLEEAAVEVVDLSSPSPRPLDQFQGGFSPPPWDLTRESFDAVTSTTRSRKNLTSEFGYQPTGGTEVDTGNPKEEETSAAEQPMEVSDPSPCQTSREKNGLQRQGSAGVQVSSPKKRETRAASMQFNQRNCTARTFQWDEEDDISETRGSPQCSRRVSAGPISPVIASGRTSSQSKLQRRKPRKWSRDETEALKKEVFKYGKGRWKLILANNAAIFDGRTEVDLKDKWRNLERFEGLSVPE
ncbi:hypothetical protein R1sor_001980 [Riccia sorocarpa]|uniref:Uncharacterized protein n=1 Tax=Riccia sorocarpa TaxID=122646 RepID=A0ABD3GXG7_9MARC